MDKITLTPNEWHEHGDASRAYAMYLETQRTNDALEAIVRRLSSIANALAPVTSEPIPYLHIREPMSADMLTARAEYNKNHAAELYGDKLYCDGIPLRWFEFGTNKPVLFTPYGYIHDPEEY